MRTITSLSLGVIFLSSCTVRADEPRGLPEFRKQRRAIETQLLSANLNDRMAGMGELKKYPLLDAVKLALPYWSKDPNPHVRAAAAEVLYGFKDDKTLRPAMQEMIRREVSETNAILVAVWLAGAAPGEEKEVLEPLGKLTGRQPTLFALFPVIDWLGTRHEAATVRVLTGFAGLPAFKSQFGFRRAIVTALIAMRHPDAVSQLIVLLPDVDGEVRGDIVEHLGRLSGQTLGFDQAAWLAWWNPRKGSFQFPDPDAKPGLIAIQAGIPSYYGIPVYGKKVIFILDTSGSMKGQRIISAKRELVKAVENLPSETTLNLVSFNEELDLWSRKLLTASPDLKTRAVRWVNGLEPGGSTFTYDALKATLDLQPEAIYLLTDGEPTGGSLVEPAAILAAVQQTNRYRRTSIHVIGVNPGPEDGIFSQFLKNLAAQNWGQYRRVD